MAKRSQDLLLTDESDLGKYISRKAIHNSIGADDLFRLFSNEELKSYNIPIDEDGMVVLSEEEMNLLGFLCVAIRRYIKEFPAADAVSTEVLRQVMWERDMAITQLREDYGVGLGEIKAEAFHNDH